jgi:hypothetical protein
MSSWNHDDERNQEFSATTRHHVLNARGRGSSEIGKEAISARSNHEYRRAREFPRAFARSSRGIENEHWPSPRGETPPWPGVVPARPPESLDGVMVDTVAAVTHIDDIKGAHASAPRSKRFNIIPPCL